jgi:hypothetical protein
MVAKKEHGVTDGEAANAQLVHHRGEHRQHVVADSEATDGTTRKRLPI